VSTAKRRRADRRPSVNRMQVEIACNDPDNGLFAGRATAIGFCARGERISLEGADVKFTDNGDTIRLFRRTARVIDSRQWFGNWCWNVYIVPIADAAFFLHRAHKHGFQADMAEGDFACKVSDALDEDAPIGELQLYLSLFGSAE
jgi:hypothetical protein